MIGVSAGATSAIRHLAEIARLRRADRGWGDGESTDRVTPLVESVAASPSHPGNLSTTCVDGIIECIFQWALLVSDCVVCASAKFAIKNLCHWITENY
jgi:hypothetical protein